MSKLAHSNDETMAWIEENCEPGPDPSDFCTHEDYEVNWDGRASCTCGHSWWLTSEQMQAQDLAMRAYAEWEYREARKFNRWWKRLGRWIYHRVWCWRDQEIPF